MDIHLLRTLLAVCERGSFSEAAQELSLTQPTVSCHIRSLEEELGTPLFDRLPRSVELTQAGRELLHHARRIMSLHDSAVDAVRRSSGIVAGHLRIGGSTIPGEYILPILLSGFKDLHPGVLIQLTIGDTRSVLEEVQAGHLEVGLVGAPPESSVLAASPFGGDHLVLIYNPSALPLRPGAGTPLELLLDSGLWLREEGSATRECLLRFLAAAGHDLDDLRVLGMLGSTEAIKQAVMAGRGMAVVSDLAVKREIGDGRLAGVALDDAGAMRRFHFVRHRRRKSSPSVAAFIDYAAGFKTTFGG
jgi:DNA-binding transcriptional LysR family regulator